MIEFTAVLPKPFRVAVVSARGKADPRCPDVIHLTKLSLKIGKKTIDIPKSIYSEVDGVILRTLQLRYTRLGSDDDFDFSIMFRYGAYAYEDDRVVSGRPQATVYIVSGRVQRLITVCNINATESEATTLDFMTNRRSSVVVKTRLENR